MKLEIFRCICGGPHFLSVSLDAPEDAYFYLEGCWHYTGLSGWFKRVWYALRGKDFHEPCVLLSRDTCVSLLTALQTAYPNLLWENPE